MTVFFPTLRLLSKKERKASLVVQGSKKLKKMETQFIFGLDQPCLRRH